ncbi:MAG: nucleotidyltransferase domain-containing protein [Firmicutes bacterium]|nr:nucleotidyltransferase domain-containing protein [Bacillota bacterium]
MNIPEFGFNDKTLELIINLFGNSEQIEEVRIFGSRALGTYKPNSDIDLVFYGNFSDKFKSRLAGDLDELPLPYTFDVLLYDEITNDNLKKHIHDYGKILYRRK